MKQKKIITPKGFDEGDILRQVRQEYEQGLNSVQAKREKIKKDLQQYYVAATKKDKVNINTIYTTMQTLMSVYYLDKSIVEFQGRTTATAPYAENLNRLAEFDYDEMGLDKVDYQWNWDRFFHGVGIKVIDGWDKYTKTPIARTVSPLSWIPDPQGGVSIESHRWAGFEVEVTKSSLGDAFYNVDLINNGPADIQTEVRQAYESGRDISDFGIDDGENAKYSIYHHYTRIKGKPYLITTANHHSVILRMMEIEPVLKEEKDDANKIMFPIALKYYSPVKGDPFGISVPDLLRDKQSAESKLFNLTLISAQRNALGDDKLYNPKKIKNIRDLKTPTIGGKYIAANVNENEPLSNALMSVPKENPTSLPFNIEERITQVEQLSTGINANTMGVGGMQNMTAAESQSIQKNANLRFILGTRIGMWGEKDFWKLWFRSYIYNLSGTAKKVFAITKVFGSSYFEMSRDDFITNENIKIVIRNRSEIENEKAKYKNDLYGIGPQILADPMTPAVGKRLIKRKMMDFGLFSEEEIQMTTFDLDEQNAKLDVQLINEGIEPSPIQEGQDHLTYITQFYGANDNEIKRKAIKEREEAYAQSLAKQAADAGQLQAMAGQGNNTMMNIASSNAASRQGAAINQETKNTASLQDLQ